MKERFRLSLKIASAYSRLCVSVTDRILVRAAIHRDLRPCGRTTVLGGTGVIVGSQNFRVPLHLQRQRPGPCGRCVGVSWSRNGLPLKCGANAEGCRLFRIATHPLEIPPGHVQTRARRVRAYRRKARCGAGIRAGSIVSLLKMHVSPWGGLSTRDLLPRVEIGHRIGRGWVAPDPGSRIPTPVKSPGWQEETIAHGDGLTPPGTIEPDHLRAGPASSTAGGSGHPARP